MICILFMFNHYQSKSIISIFLLLLLAGCSISPRPVSEQERAKQVKVDLKQLFPSQVNVKNGLSIETAIAYALKFNINQQVKEMDVAIADRYKKLSSYEQLPSLIANPEYIARDRETKFDQDLRQTTGNLSMAWNVLDFGITYIQARQNNNRMLIAEEKHRAAANKIIKETKRFFWRSIAAERLAQSLEPLQKKLKIALKNSRQAEQKRLQPPIQILDFQKSLLEILNQLKQLQKELSAAKVNLARSLNLNPGSNFRLITPQSELNIAELKLPDISKLEEYALLNRPELYEKDYQRRIQADETRKAMLRFLPGLEFNVAGRYDSGDSFVNHSWAEAGLKITWNMINLFSAPEKLNLMKHKEELQELKSLALSMSVLTQVHIAYRHFYEAQANYQIANHLNDVTQRIYQHATAGRQAANLSELELIRREADAVLYSIRQHMAYAELQNASGELMLSVGKRLLPTNYRTLSVLKMSLFLAKKPKTWFEDSTKAKISSGWTITKNRLKTKDKPIESNNVRISRPTPILTEDAVVQSNDWIVTKNLSSNSYRGKTEVNLDSKNHSTKLNNKNKSIDNSLPVKSIRLWYID